MVHTAEVICNSDKSVEALSVVIRHCQSVEIQDKLWIDEDISTQSWGVLRRALSWQKVNFVYSPKEVMASARREDLKAIWESLIHGWTVWPFTLAPGWQRKHFSKHEHDWGRVEQYLDMSNDEWPGPQSSSDEEERTSSDEDENSMEDVGDSNDEDGGDGGDGDEHF